MTREIPNGCGAAPKPHPNTRGAGNDGNWSHSVRKSKSSVTYISILQNINLQTTYQQDSGVHLNYRKDRL